MISKEKKTAIIKEYARTEGDTGSPEVQVAVLTARIQELTEHLKSNPKDHHSRRGLLQMVGQRRGLLDYLKKTDIERYRTLIDRLAQRCFAGAVASRQGVAHDAKSGYRSNSETTDKRIEASVFFSSFGSFVFRFFHHPKRFRNNFQQQGKRKGETECTRHFPWNWPDVR